MKKTLNVTLAVEVDAIIDSVDDIVNNISFDANECSENVEVVNVSIIDFFEV